MPRLPARSPVELSERGNHTLLFLSLSLCSLKINKILKKQTNTTFLCPMVCWQMLDSWFFRNPNVYVTDAGVFMINLTDIKDAEHTVCQILVSVVNL